MPCCSFRCCDLLVFLFWRWTFTMLFLKGVAVFPDWSHMDDRGNKQRPSQFFQGYVILSALNVQVGRPWDGMVVDEKSLCYSVGQTCSITKGHWILWAGWRYNGKLSNTIQYFQFASVVIFWCFTILICCIWHQAAGIVRLRIQHNSLLLTRWYKKVKNSLWWHCSSGTKEPTYVFAIDLALQSLG